jgi:magnesium transporter
VAGQGGNAGTQTATIAVRSLALGDLYVRDIFRAARKEIVVGIANGSVVGVTAGLVSFLWLHNLALSVLLATALLLTVSLATLNGILIPLTLRAMKVDPALATNIFVTMLTDVLGFFIFLGLAFLFIEQLT